MTEHYRPPTDKGGIWAFIALAFIVVLGATAMFLMAYPVSRLP